MALKKKTGANRTLPSFTEFYLTQKSNGIACLQVVQFDQFDFFFKLEIPFVLLYLNDQNQSQFRQLIEFSKNNEIGLSYTMSNLFYEVFIFCF